MERKVGPEDLCAYVLTLPAFTHNEQQHTLLSSSRDELQRAINVTDIFQLLVNRYASFLNYDIFQMLVERYDLDVGQEQLKYPEHLKIYLETHSIADFIEANPGPYSVTSPSTSIALKVNVPTMCSLSTLIDLRRQLARVFGITPSGLMLVDAKEGCVVTFEVLGPIGRLIFAGDKADVLSQEQVWKLQGLSVQWLKFNDYEWDLSVDTPGKSLIPVNLSP